MKSPASRTAVLLLAIFLAGAHLLADEVVSTGYVESVSSRAGTLRIRSDQLAGRTLVFYGMAYANIMTVGGQSAQLEDLQPGMPVTVFYTRSGLNWTVSKFLIEDQTSPPSGPGSESLWNSYVRITPADVDGDITTNGPDWARLVPDRTRIPASGSRGGVRRTAP